MKTAYRIQSQLHGDRSYCENLFCNPGTNYFEARKTGEKKVGKTPNHPHALPIVLYMHDLT